jgi:hypothetical protein
MNRRVRSGRVEAGAEKSGIRARSMVRRPWCRRQRVCRAAAPLFYKIPILRYLRVIGSPRPDGTTFATPILRQDDGKTAHGGDGADHSLLVCSRPKGSGETECRSVLQRAEGEGPMAQIVGRCRDDLSYFLRLEIRAKRCPHASTLQPRVKEATTTGRPAGARH